MRKSSGIPKGSIPKCVFAHEMFHSVDDQVDNLYKASGKRAPFGDFRRSWWRYHCLELSGPDHCPYLPRDCALAFLRVAQLSVAADRPGAMFRVIAKDHAIRRLEGKPLARDQKSSTPPAWLDAGRVGSDPQQGDQSGPDQRLLPPADRDTVGMGENRQPMRRSLSRPTRIGDLLRRNTTRSREVPADDRQEGT